MNIDVCKEQIKRHEGEVLEVYLDSLDLKTLGIGHLLQPSDPEYDWEVGTSVSQEVVDKYFKDDFDKHYKEGMSFKECREFMINGKEFFKEIPLLTTTIAISLAMARDGSSGGVVRLMNITKDKEEREFIDYNDLPN